MGANLNKNENSFFILSKPGWSGGAVAAGLPGYSESQMPVAPVENVDKYSDKYTWLVCPHLARPELVFQYYLASGLITVVLGKCFCESCLDRILSNEDLLDLIDACRPMTDRIFQEDFVSPLMDSNFSFNQIVEVANTVSEHPPKNWITCRHTASRGALRKAYASGGQLFIFEGFFTCQECFEKIPTDSLVDLLYEGETMTDAFFQNKIVNSLYDINYESLNAVGHFELCRHK
jgi:hypothetical protein